MKISVCIISFNEENKIEECIKSVLKIADEIIIIDSYSSDKTIEISRKYTDKIFYKKFSGYGAQKKFAVSKASNDWILSLDCDERLSQELINSIVSIKDSLDEKFVYMMPRRTFYIYKWLNYCWYPDRIIRLFNKQYSEFCGQILHESIVPGNNVRIKRLKGDILHFSYDSISKHLQTIDKYTKIAAAELSKKNRSVNIFSPFFHGAIRFIKMYFLKKGFLDGMEGLTVSLISFVYVYLKYYRYWLLKKKIENV